MQNHNQNHYALPCFPIEDQWLHSLMSGDKPNIPTNETNKINKVFQTG